MGVVIGQPLNIAQGTILDSLFNFADSAPVPIVTINEPIYPVFFALYFTDVTTNFEFNIASSAIQLKDTNTGNVFMSLEIAPAAVAEKNSFINVIPLHAYRPTADNFPFVAPCSINLILSAALSVRGTGSIRYNFGYIYI